MGVASDTLMHLVRTHNSLKRDFERNPFNGPSLS